MTDHAVAEPVSRDQPPAEAGVGGRVPRDVLTGPLYPRVLRLRNLNPTAWQRAILVEGVASVGAILALADVITAWAPILLPVSVAGVVKFHDVLIGILGPRSDVGAGTADRSPEPAAAAAPPSGVRVVPSPEPSGAATAAAAPAAAPSAPVREVEAPAAELPAAVTTRSAATGQAAAAAPPLPAPSPVPPAEGPVRVAAPPAEGPVRVAAPPAEGPVRVAAPPAEDLAPVAARPAAAGEATFRVVPAPEAPAPEVPALLPTEAASPAAVQPIVSPEVAEDDIDILRDEAGEIAAELLRLDGEVGLFALGIDHDGEVVPVETVEAYDRVPLDVRVAALRREAVRAAGAGEVRAVAIAVGRDGALFLEVDHAAAEPVRLEIPLTGRVRTAWRHAGTSYVAEWGDPPD